MLHGRLSIWLAIGCLLLSQQSLSPSALGQATYLHQGWNEEQREEFYFTAQGSQLIPYKWFLELEQANEDKPFRDADNILKYGYLPTKPTHRNPDGLPIGFVRDGVDPVANQLAGLESTQAAVIQSSTRFNVKSAYLGPEFNESLYPKERESWFGLTCAACHTHEMVYGKTTLRIDGGSAQADAESFLRDLGIALEKTAQTPEKLARFANRVGRDPSSLGEFKQEVKQISEAVNRLVERNQAKHPYGYARLDAFGAILNAVCETALNEPASRREANAPISYPTLWNTPAMGYVQSNASAANAEGRNVGEVLGVFGTYTLDSGEKQFDSTVRLRNLVKLEHELLTKLVAPDWPTEVFGELDSEKVQLGKTLFARNCVSCHGIRDASGKFALNGAGRIPIRSNTLQEVRTDPQFLMNLNPRDPKNLVSTGALKPLLGNLAQVPRPNMLRLVVGKILINRAIAEQVDLTQWQAGPQDPPHPSGVGSGYIARPLEGIWASAPYFHNGSVPNLYETLLPVAQRSTTFWIGSRRFDPIKVGYVMDQSPIGSKFSVVDAAGVAIPGNSNAGHEGHGANENEGFTQTFENGAWRDFTDDERYGLVEYMKSLSSNPPINVELVPNGEAIRIANIVELTAKRMQMQYAGEKRVLRGVHPKDHGCVTAKFEVLPNLPAKYAVGVFQPGATYKAFIRFSNANVEISSDSPRDAAGNPQHGSRGMAIKLTGVAGQTLLPLHGSLTQDFVMVNQPAFAFANVEDYELLSQVLVDHFGDPRGVQNFFTRRATGTPEQRQRAARTAQIVKRIAANAVDGDKGAFFPPPASPVDNPYFSAAPFRFGNDRVMRFRALPTAPSAEAPDLSDPNYLRTALIKRLKSEAVEFEFGIQVRSYDQLDLAKDIENASTEWNDEFLPVAKITIPPQEFDTPELREKCEQLFFTPWHGIKEHEPLGGINRLRKEVYLSSSKHQSIPKEPASIDK